VDLDRRVVVETVAEHRQPFEQLVGRYHVRIYKLARILTHGSADAEDLVQETFVRAFRAIGGFRGDSSVETWLYRIAVNVIKTHLNRQRQWDAVTVQSASVEDDYSLTLEAVASTEDLELDVTRRDAIHRALATLPDGLRVLVTLRDVEGLEYQEIAIVTGLPQGTVASRVFHARRQLRPMLECLLRRSSLVAIL
jgi:RNA polymerase sigma-70 factor (ECF subfamily)